MRSRALFLDRDGIVNEDHGFVWKSEEIIFQKGILELGRFFTSRKWKIIIVSNQSGIARGLYQAEDVLKVHEFIREKFSFHRIKIDDFYFCPHYPPVSGPCNCRKPEPGMMLAAADKHYIDLPASIMVGDKDSDMQAAKAAGIGSRYLLPGNYDASGDEGVIVIDDLREIIRIESRRLGVPDPAAS